MIDNKSMSFSVDDFVKSLTNLDTIATARLPLVQAEASGRFVKADLGMFRDNKDGSVWKIEMAEDGKDYIVRTSSDDNVVEGDWAAAVNRSRTAITLAYAGKPIKAFGGQDYQFTPDTAQVFAKVLIKKANTDPKGFVKGLVASLPFEERVALQNQFAIFRQV